MALNNSSGNNSYEFGSSGFGTGGFSKFEIAALVVTRFIIILIAIPDNVLVIFIIIRVQIMRTSTNYLLLNLCIADLFIAVLSLPFVTVDLYITGYWVFGEFMCRIVSFSKSVGNKASILILMALSIDRYLTICRPQQVFITMKRIRIVCIVLWTIAICVTLPVFIVKTTISHRGKDICLETWSIEEAAIYTCLVVVLFYVIPLMVMTVLYIKIGQKLWHSTRRTKSMGLVGSVRQATAASKSRLTKICIMILICFALSWAPSHILTLLYYFGDPESLDRKILLSIVYPTVSCITFSNCALNPLLYCFMSQNFRNAIKSEWKRLTTKRQHQDDLPGMRLRSRTVSVRLQGLLSSKSNNDNEKQQGFTNSNSMTMFETAM